MDTIEDFNREDVCKIYTYCKNTINRDKIQIKNSKTEDLTGKMCVSPRLRLSLHTGRATAMER